MRPAVFLVLAAGCGASSTMGKDDSAAIAAQLGTLSAAALASAQDALPSPGAPLSTSAEQSIACSAGGSAGVSGDLDGDFAADLTGTYSLDLMSTFADCVVGNGIVINGAPYLATTGTLSFRGGALVTGTITFSGALTAGNDTCNVDVMLHLPGGAASGAVCGNALRVAQ
ncbi:MAG TPA: hypothetical protein VGF94_16690 [Kofleriaceae bacterium]|jgi:hypothetical protein